MLSGNSYPPKEACVSIVNVLTYRTTVPVTAKETESERTRGHKPSSVRDAHETQRGLKQYFLLISSNPLHHKWTDTRAESRLYCGSNRKRREAHNSSLGYQSPGAD